MYANTCTLFSFQRKERDQQMENQSVGSSSSHSSFEKNDDGNRQCFHSFRFSFENLVFMCVCVCVFQTLGNILITKFLLDKTLPYNFL